ncbi:MAG: GatB/YqeY domain-containing protein [bacterium]
MSELKDVIGDATKEAMKARDKERLAVLRMVNSELKRIEVDERRELSDADVMNVLNKMLKQRQDAMKQFADAGRDDLAAQEAFEIEVVQFFLPAQLSDAELTALVDKVVTESGASGMQDMGKVMAAVKAAAAGQADMGRASGLVKARLSQ